MLNPEKYINEKRLLGHAKYKASKYKWSPRLGKYVRVHTQPTTPKNITERRENVTRIYIITLVITIRFIFTHEYATEEILSLTKS